MVRAKDIMTREVVTVRRWAPIYAAVKLLLENEVTGVPVVEDDMTLVGILTEKDVLQLYYAPEYGRDKTVDEFMTEPAVHFGANESLDEICSCLVENTFRRVPVTSNGKVVGIVSRPDVIAHIAQLAGETVTAAQAAETPEAEKKES